MQAPQIGKLIENTETLPRTFSTFDLVCLVFGTIVGAGIFKAPSIVAPLVGSGFEFLLVWLLGGLISAAGVLCYGELCSTYPSAGGDYNFILRSFGRNIAFLYAWARATVLVTGSIAILSITFGDYASAILHQEAFSKVTCSVAIVVLITLINLFGISASKVAQNLCTILEFIGITLVIIAGIFVPSEHVTWEKILSSSGDANYGLAMVFVLLTYGGWNEIAYVSAEAKDERHGLLKALIFGLGLVTLIYMLTNFAYLNALGLDQIAKSNAVAYDLLVIAIGSSSATLFGLIICFSCLNSINATMIFGARSNYAVGKNHHIFAWLGIWNRSGNPINSIILQSAIAICLILLSAEKKEGFQALVEFTAPIFWLFMLLVGVSVILQRLREPNIDRPFKVPFYPFIPIVFITSSGFLLWSSLLHAGASAWIGIAVLLTGCIPLILEFIARKFFLS